MQNLEFKIGPKFGVNSSVFSGNAVTVNIKPPRQKIIHPVTKTLVVTMAKTIGNGIVVHWVTFKIELIIFVQQLRL